MRKFVVSNYGLLLENNSLIETVHVKQQECSIMEFLTQIIEVKYEHFH